VIGGATKAILKVLGKIFLDFIGVILLLLKIVLPNICKCILFRFVKEYFYRAIGIVYYCRIFCDFKYIKNLISQYNRILRRRAKWF